MNADAEGAVTTSASVTNLDAASGQREKNEEDGDSYGEKPRAEQHGAIQGRCSSSAPPSPPTLLPDPNNMRLVCAVHMVSESPGAYTRTPARGYGLQADMPNCNEAVSTVDARVTCEGGSRYPNCKSWT